MPALPDRAQQVIGLTARAWGIAKPSPRAIARPGPSPAVPVAHAAQAKGLAIYPAASRSSIFRPVDILAYSPMASGVNACASVSSRV